MLKHSTSDSCPVIGHWQHAPNRTAGSTSDSYLKPFISRCDHSPLVLVMRRQYRKQPARLDMCRFHDNFKEESSAFEKDEKNLV